MRGLLYEATWRGWGRKRSWRCSR